MYLKKTKTAITDDIPIAAVIILLFFVLINVWLFNKYPIKNENSEIVSITSRVIVLNRGSARSMQMLHKRRKISQRKLLTELHVFQDFINLILNSGWKN